MTDEERAGCADSACRSAVSGVLSEPVALHLERRLEPVLSNPVGRSQHGVAELVEQILPVEHQGDREPLAGR